MVHPHLFQPMTLRGITLKNRIVISPMCQYSAIDGVASDWHLVHLGKFAQGGAGAVMVEATAVAPEGRITHGDVGLWHDGQIAPLKRIATFIKENGSIPAIQLAHAGRKASMQRPWFGNAALDDGERGRGDLPWQVVAPSAIPMARIIAMRNTRNTPNCSSPTLHWPCRNDGSRTRCALAPQIQVAAAALMNSSPIVNSTWRRWLAS